MDGAKGNGASIGIGIRLRGNPEESRAFPDLARSASLPRMAADRVIGKFNLLAATRSLAHLVQGAIARKDLTLPR